MSVELPWMFVIATLLIVQRLLVLWWIGEGPRPRSAVAGATSAGIERADQPGLGLVLLGAAIGFGSFWRFPYIAGGGGPAFLLLYVLALIVLAGPLAALELAIGRFMRRDPVGALEVPGGQPWQHSLGLVAGWSATLAGFLTFCLVVLVGGWSLVYFLGSIGGGLAADPEQLQFQFSAMLESPWTSIGALVLLTLPVLFVSARGTAVVSRVVGRLTLVLLMLLGGLLMHAVVASDVDSALAYLFDTRDFDLSTNLAYEAFGYAFFTLGVGTGVMLAFGAHAPRATGLVGTVVSVAFADVVVALVAAVVVNGAVFAAGGEPWSGPGLVFITLPSAYAALPGGELALSAFFAVLVLAAITSALALAEPAIAVLTRLLDRQRGRAVQLLTGAVLLVGTVEALSFNVLADVTFGDLTLFDLIDLSANAVLMPIAALTLVLFGVTVASGDVLRSEAGVRGPVAAAVWALVTGPLLLLVTLVFVAELLVARFG